MTAPLAGPDDLAALPPEVEARQTAALRLAREGFLIAQVYGVRRDGRCSCGLADCGAPGKHGGKGWMEQATRDPDVIRTRFLRGEPNYGAVPPAGSGLLVVDEDQPGSLETLGPLPDTLTVLTGPKGADARGRHVYGRLPDGIAESDIPYLWAGGEVRIASNGQAVGPYSRHASGTIYQPVNGSAVATLSEPWVRALIASARRQNAERSAARGPADVGWKITKGRHDWLKGKARWLRGNGLSGDRLVDELLRLDRDRCDPPLVEVPERGEAEIRSIAAWVETKIGDDPPPITITGTAPARFDPEPMAARASGSIGTRTALDLRHGTPPDQLADPFLTPEGPTVIYARGGTGKGMIACWLAIRLVRAGYIVMVIDFEGHEREWGSRLRGLGATDDELSQVHYRAPFGADWTAGTGPLSKVAGLIRDDAQALGVTYLIVDSYSVATSNGDTMGGEAAAREYFSALAMIGLPSLTIAHVRGDSGKFPERPFGSVFVHNLARETWAVERLGEDPAEAPDHDEIRFGPHVVALELRNRKANARAASPAQFLTFSFYGDGTIDATTDGPGGRSVADLAADALADGPMTLSAIAAAIKEDTGQKVAEDTIKRAMLRHPTRFIHESTGPRPRPWSLR